MAREPTAPELVLECMGLGVKIRQALAVALLPYGITPEQHELLSLLAAGKSSPRELAEASGRDKTTLSRVIARAARAGLVEQDRRPEDRRRQVLRLTDRGSVTVDQTRRMLERSAPKLLAALSAKEQRRLEKILRKLKSPPA